MTDDTEDIDDINDAHTTYTWPDEVLEAVEELTKDMPEFGPDERQETFFGVLPVAREVAGERNVAINMRGFPASFVDLGYVQAKCKEMLKRFHKGRGQFRHESKVLFWPLISRMIQRHKQLYIERKAYGFELRIVTKDDKGYYSYELAVNCRDIGAPWD